MSIRIDISVHPCDSHLKQNKYSHQSGFKRLMVKNYLQKMESYFQTDELGNKDCFVLQIRRNTSTNWDYFVNEASRFHIQQI